MDRLSYARARRRWERRMADRERRGHSRRKATEGERRVFEALRLACAKVAVGLYGKCAFMVEVDRDGVEVTETGGR